MCSRVHFNSQTNAEYSNNILYIFVLSLEMGESDISGGAMGRYFGKGKVYIMRNGQSKYKIGCSGDPARRLKEIQRERPNVKLLSTTKATEMNGAETAAQKANIKNGSKRATKVASDWFIKPKRKSWDQIINTTKNAVYRHNRQW